MIFNRRTQLLVLLFNSVGGSVTLPYLCRVCSCLWSLADLHTVTESLSCSTQMFPAELEGGSALSSCFSCFCKQVSFLLSI